VVLVPAGGQDAQLEQIREMQARLNEEAGQLVQLRQNIGQEWAGRAPAGEARHLAQDVQHRIADDARARLPPASSGVGQNLAAAAILLRAIPEPSTTEGRRIQGELKNLLEDVAVRWDESSASRRQGYPRSIASRLPDSCGKPRSTPGARRTQRLQPRVASATSTTATTVEPTSMRRCVEATAPGVGSLRQRGGSEPFAQTTRSTGFQPSHTTGVVPDLNLNLDYHHQVLGGDKAGTVAHGLSAGLPAGWNGR
jgi:hypothetical protein